MRPFDYHRPDTPDAALKHAGEGVGLPEFLRLRSICFQ